MVYFYFFIRGNTDLLFIFMIIIYESPGTYKLNKRREKITYRAGKARPWTVVKCMTCCFNSNVNVFFISLAYPRYNISCSWIYCLKCLSCFFNNNKSFSKVILVCMYIYIYIYIHTHKFVIYIYIRLS